jgi:hypothetical protein
MGKACRVLRLRMRGVIPLIPLYAFITWTGKNLALGMLQMGVILISNFHREMNTDILV